MNKEEAMTLLQKMNADRGELEQLVNRIDDVGSLEGRQAELLDEIAKLEAKRAELEEATRLPRDTRQFEELTYQQIKELRKDIDQIKSNTARPTTKEDILSIKSTQKRLEAIRENLDLFKDNMLTRG